MVGLGAVGPRHRVYLSWWLHGWSLLSCSTNPPKRGKLYLDVPLEVRINGDRINGLFHLITYTWGDRCEGFSPTDPITIDPNFQRDIQVVFF